MCLYVCGCMCVWGMWVCGCTVCVSVCGCVGVWAHMCHGVHGEVRGQVGGFGPLFSPLHGFWGSNSCQQTWFKHLFQQVHLPGPGFSLYRSTQNNLTAPQSPYTSHSLLLPLTANGHRFHYCSSQDAVVGLMLHMWPFVLTLSSVQVVRGLTDHIALLNNIPLYGCATACLFLGALKNILGRPKFS